MKESNLIITPEQAVRRLAIEHPEWLPVLEAAVTVAANVEAHGGEFAGAWVVDELGPAFLADLEDGSIALVDLVRTDHVRVRELLERYTDLTLDSWTPPSSPSLNGCARGSSHL